MNQFHISYLHLVYRHKIMYTTPFKVLTISIFCLIIAFSAQAQYAPQNVAKANILGLGIGGFSLAYERAINEDLSAAITGRFMFYDFEDTQTFTFGSLGSVDVDYKMDLRLIGILPEGRLYLFSFFEKEAPEGFFLSPYAGYTQTRIRVGSLTSNFTINGGTTISFLEFGGTIGYQFLIADRITLDFFSGLGFTTFTLKNVDAEIISTTSNETINDLIRFDRRLPLGATLTGTLPRFGASIGIAF